MTARINRLGQKRETLWCCMRLSWGWRETTAYAGDEDFIFASDRRRGKRPRVPNMLVEDHLRPAAKQVIEIPPGHRFGFHKAGALPASFMIRKRACIGLPLQDCCWQPLSRSVYAGSDYGWIRSSSV